MSDSAHRPRLAIFARVPVLGHVKTRLAATVGDESALSVYEALLAATLAELVPGNGVFVPEVWVDGDVDAFARWQCRSNAGAMRNLRFPLVAQSDGNLGQRMAAAFDDGVTVLVGSDIPDMTAGYVGTALRLLAVADIVIGPTEDGGYCLIGMNSPHPQLFEGIPWSTPAVLTSTIRAAGNLRLELLEAMWDLDDADDLARWCRAPARPLG
ncbi:MAG: TIGR04282 family arsenosugar biosynthesis glycosyltransferase [Gammaproteobacteria bacterium]|nr:TIGR04282 family arsenosugar biosynthesis glycosyltransferase [Gammaproteobacteria bacterium]